jgi:hypothetical protein
MLDFSHEAAYKLLLRFRHVPTAIKGFLALTSANVHITDASMSQTLIGSTDGNVLTGTVLNFSGGPYVELFDGLCALSSSSTPMLTVHELSSYDTIEAAYIDSRLGSFLVSKVACRTHRGLSLTAHIKYPTWC